MGLDVELTKLAERQVDLLRGPHMRSFDTFISDLERRGCAAISGRTGYRLSGEFPVDRLCSQHLHATYRAIVAFESAELAIVITVGPHAEGAAQDVYNNLWKVLGLAAPPSDERLKPDCCDSSGTAPLLPPDDVVEVMQRCKQLAKLIT